MQRAMHAEDGSTMRIAWTGRLTSGIRELFSVQFEGSCFDIFALLDDFLVGGNVKMDEEQRIGGMSVLV